MKSVDFEEIIKRIERYDFPEADAVVGIGTGGSVPAALVAYRLKRPLHMVRVRFRDPQNVPVENEPQPMGPFTAPAARRVLLVDDVSVSGKTLEAVRKLMPGLDVKTFVLAGPADHVLFPEVRGCVAWPWKT